MLACLLLVTGLGGCSAGNGTAEPTEAAPADIPQEEIMPTEEMTDTIIEIPEEVKDVPAAPAETEPLPLGNPFWEGLAVSPKNCGKPAALAPAEKAIPVSAEEAEELYVSSRAWGLTDTSCFVNKAKTYYYFSQLDDNARDLYKAIYRILCYPANAENVACALLDYAPDSDRLERDETLAYAAIRYDHPELFWAYMGESRPYTVRYYIGEQIGGWYPVYLSLRQANPEADALGVGLSKAAEQFLALVPDKLSDAEKVRKVHDLLIQNVICDPLAEDRDYAHFAFGALCRNSGGQAFHAACDGYALGFLYLLQQLDIEAVVVGGYAGDSENMREHVWSLVKLDGQWGEYDTVWNDEDEDWTVIYADQWYYPVIVSAWNNASYREMVSHAFYALTTRRINNYVNETACRLYENGSWVRMVPDSCRERYEPAADGVMGELMQYAPIAQ